MFLINLFSSRQYLETTGFIARCIIVFPKPVSPLPDSTIHLIASYQFLGFRLQYHA